MPDGWIRTNTISALYQHERDASATKFGVVFPQTEIGSDPVALRDFAQAVEGLGYDDILIYGVRFSVLHIERRAV